MLLRTPWVTQRAAELSSDLLKREFGADATYNITVRPFPFSASLEDVVIEGSDGQGPFLTIERISVRPRVFSLLGGKLHAGDLDVVGARARITIRDGKLTSFAPNLPESGDSEGPGELPLSAASITDLDLDLDLEGLQLFVHEIDVDLAVESDQALELGLRAGGGVLTRRYEDPAHPGSDRVDEDRICRLETRLRFEPADLTLLVRRLSFGAVTDIDPAAGTRPSCDVVEGDWRKVEISAGALSVPIGQLVETERAGGIQGRVGVVAPSHLLHRFVKLPHMNGSASVDLELSRDELGLSPHARGKVRTDFVGLDGKVFSDKFEADVSWDGRVVLAENIQARWADGDIGIERVSFEPFEKGMPLAAQNVAIDNVNLQGLLRDLGAHPQAHVAWLLERTEFPSFGGTLDPLALSGKLSTKTRDFGIYDRAAHRPDRRRMMTVDRGNITGALIIRDDAVVLEGMHLNTPRSEVFASVTLGFNNYLGIQIGKGSVVDFAELSPLVSVPIGGRAQITASGGGAFEHPRIDGDVSIEKFSIGGFEAGDVRRASVHFEPLFLDLKNVELEKGKSLVTAPNAKVDFDRGADVYVEAEVEATRAPYLHIADFLQVFQFDKDPRFSDLAGVAIGNANVKYAIGGTLDACGGGKLDVVGKMKLEKPTLFGESFDRGEMALAFDWFDATAGDRGMKVDLTDVTLHDGTGTIVGHAHVRDGGLLTGRLIASGFPVDRLEGLGKVAAFIDTEAQGFFELGGTLARPQATVDLSLGPLRMGSRRMPPSRVLIELEADTLPEKVVDETSCRRPITEPFSRAEYDKDLPGGQFRLNGQLFGGQIRLEDITLSRQRSSVTRGRISISGLDLGTVAAGLPQFRGTGVLPEGSLSAQVDIGYLNADNLQNTAVALELFDFELRKGGRSVELDDAPEPLLIRGDDITIPEVAMAVVGAGGLRLSFQGEGTLRDLASNATVDAALRIDPFDLSKLRSELTGVERLAGELKGAVSIKGSASRPIVTGNIELRRGALALASPPVTLDKVDVDVQLGGGELRVTRASAQVGAGTVDVSGRVPLDGLGLGAGSGTITARGVKLPVGDGIDVVADADLEARLPPSSSLDLPSITGTLKLKSFSYTRPVALSIDLSALSRSIGRADVEGIDPKNDLMRFDVAVVSDAPLRVQNDLADLRLEVMAPGIQFAGTNQKYGARGGLKLLSESKIRLRNHEFEVQEGFVRFDDPAKIEANIDVRAETELKRYASAGDSTADAGATGGNWSIGVRAHGTTEDLRLDLWSDPTMDQDDIVLLLTVGMTRAEMDRSLATSLGETVGLEALGALTGADKAVRSVVPIDYFHFGSGYSSKTGRTEPNVTVGKRLTDDLRASVTTTLTQRDVGATLEWRLQKGLSVQAAYDNTNDIGSIVGNLGADLRWRLEFE